MNLLSVENVAFTVLGYPLSYVELAGTLLYLWSVWLISRRKILTWPVGIASVLLFMALFYQIRLYSDAAEQAYYLIASVYGWWIWTRSPREKDRVIDIRFSSPRRILALATVCAGLAIVAALFVGRIHIYFPAAFPEAASFPYLDALTTVMSFTAMWLMVRKRVEGWVYWILVDVMGIGLYHAKSVDFIALLYVVLLLLAVRGLLSWIRASRKVAAYGP